MPYSWNSPVCNDRHSKPTCILRNFVHCCALRPSHCHNWVKKYQLFFPDVKVSKLFMNSVQLYFLKWNKLLSKLIYNCKCEHLLVWCILIRIPFRLSNRPPPHQSSSSFALLLQLQRKCSRLYQLTKLGFTLSFSEAKIYPTYIRRKVICFGKVICCIPIATDCWITLLKVRWRDVSLTVASYDL